jgi:chromate transport protein ChrA
MSQEKTTPATLSRWLGINLKIGLLSFGSGGRALLYHDAIVREYGWLQEEEFQEVFTITQILPGPNLVNLAVYLGYQVTGVWGAVGGLLALAAPGAFMLIAVYELLGLGSSRFDSVFKGMSIGSILLFAFLIAKMAQGLRRGVGMQKVHARKTALRVMVSLATSAVIVAGFSIYGVLVFGAILGLFVEFLA